MNEVYRYHEECRSCSHPPTAHGLWKWVDILEGAPSGIVLIQNTGCIASPTNWNGNRNCSCSCFMPQDNLKYLKKLYERLTD